MLVCKTVNFIYRNEAQSLFNLFYKSVNCVDTFDFNGYYCISKTFLGGCYCVLHCVKSKQKLLNALIIKLNILYLSRLFKTN